MKITLQQTPRKEGSINTNDVPDANDPRIEFWRDGKLIGTALRNGHHLTWNPPTGRVLGFLWKRKGHHSLPYVIYYFAYKSANAALCGGTVENPKP